MKLLLTVLLLLSPVAPTQISQKSISSINDNGFDFTIETSKVDNPVAYESGLYRHHA